MTILVVGDSHSFFWSGRDDFSSTQSHDGRFHVFHCGATIAYQCAKIRSELDTTIDDWLDKHIKLYSHAIFCFGEIDCRAHFVKQADRQGRKIEEVIEDTVERYFNVICGIRDKYNISCLIQGVPPLAPMIQSLAR